MGTTDSIHGFLAAQAKGPAFLATVAGTKPLSADPARDLELLKVAAQYVVAPVSFHFRKNLATPATVLENLYTKVLL